MSERIVWAGLNADLRPFRVIALLGSETLPMGQYASKSKAIRHARRLLREGWAIVRVEDVRVMKCPPRPGAPAVTRPEGGTPDE